MYKRSNLEYFNRILVKIKKNERAFKQENEIFIMKNYKTIEIMSYVIFITGFLLWNQLEVSWQTFKVSQIIHCILSICITISLLIPFMISHTKKHKKTIFKSKKSRKKRKQAFLGILIAMSLLTLCITGTYLFLVGNRGGDVYGESANFLHFYFSFAFILFIMYHSYYLGRYGKKKDMEKLKKILQQENKESCQNIS